MNKKNTKHTNKMWSCNECQEKIKSSDYLQLHTAREHNDDIESENGNTLLRST